MDEPQVTCGDPIVVEEPRSSPQDFVKMIGPVVTSGDVHGANLIKKTDQSSKLLENLHVRTSHDGPLDKREFLDDPCKIDIETPSIDPSTSNHSIDSCVMVTEDTSGEDTTVGDCGQHGSFQPIDGVDLLCGLQKSSSGSQGEDCEADEKNMEENNVKELEESSKPLLEENHPDQECPICTELYDTTKHKQSLLNCNHVVCDNCIKTIVNTANRANLCRVTCPICRQTTLMLEWEVRKMQEQMMESGGVCIQQEYVAPPPVLRRPGLCGALEYRFHKRFQTGHIFLFPPCVRNSNRLINRLTRLEHRCRCLYLSALVFLLFAEFFCLMFLFLPILVFVLMIVFSK